jgi:hypothetical protein
MFRKPGPGNFEQTHEVFVPYFKRNWIEIILEKAIIPFLVHLNLYGFALELWSWLQKRTIDQKLLIALIFVTIMW